MNIDNTMINNTYNEKYMIDAIVDHGHGSFVDDGIFVAVIEKEVNVSDGNASVIFSLMMDVELYNVSIMDLFDDMVVVVLRANVLRLMFFVEKTVQLKFSETEHTDCYCKCELG